MLKKWHRGISFILIVGVLVSIIPFNGLGVIQSYSAEEKSLAVKYEDFSNPNGLTFIRDAFASGGGLTVSPNIGKTALGGAFTTEKIKLKNEDSFSTYFVFSFPNRTYPYAGDGMAFSLQPMTDNPVVYRTNKFGTENLTTSISIEFDTFQNSGSNDVEPNGYHIALFKNGDPQNQNIKTAEVPDSLDDWHTNTYHVWIDYNGISDTLTVKMGMNSDVTNATEVLTVPGVDIYAILGTDEVYAGFSAASGDSREEHNVLKWLFCNDYSPIDPSDEYNETTAISTELLPVNSTQTQINYIITDHFSHPTVAEAVYLETTAGVLSSSCELTDDNGRVSVILDASDSAEVTALTNSGRVDRITILTEQESIDTDVAALDITDFLNGNPNASNITTDLSLPVAGANGTTITWASSDTDIIDNTGAVTRPSHTAGEQTVTLTATVSKGTGTAKTTEPFVFTVKAMPITEQESIDTDVAALDITDFLNGNPNASNITTDLSLPIAGANGTTITWASSDTNIIDNTGAVTRPSHTAGEQTVTLTATVSKGTGTAKTTEPFVFTVKAMAITDQASIDTDVAALDITDFLNGNPDASNITTDLPLPVAGANGTTISWKCYTKQPIYKTYFFIFRKIIGYQYVNSNLITNIGNVTRPERIYGDKTAYLQATVAKGSASPKITQMFRVIIKKKDLSASEKVNADYYWLAGKVLNGRDVNNIKEDLSFPIAGPNGASITWSTSDSSVITADGTVTRPSYNQNSQIVEVTATISLDGASKVRYFTFRVIQEEPSNAESVAEDIRALDYTSFTAENASPFSIESNLCFPESGVYGTTISWTSSNPDVVSHEGTVTRPSYEEGFQTTILTAIVGKGAAMDSKSFMVAVSPLPDTAAPVVQSSIPSEGNIVLNTCTAVIEFSEDIKVVDRQKISVKVIDEGTANPWSRYLYTNVNTSVHGSKLTIEPVFQSTEINRIEIVVREGAVEDLSGNTLQEDFELTYVRKTSRPVLQSSNIQNNQKSVDVSTPFEFIFDDVVSIDADLIQLERVQSSYNRSDVEFTFHKESDRFTITPAYELIPDSTYELTILEDAVKDSAQNPMKEQLKIRFFTAPVTQINLLSPLNSDAVYQFGDYLKLEFDTYFDASVSMYSQNSWKTTSLDYCIFGKSLYINTKSMNKENVSPDKVEYFIGDIENNESGKLTVTAKYNTHCSAFFDESEVIKVSSKQRGGRGARTYWEYRFMVAKENRGSSPKTPAAFGAEIKTPHDVTLDYGRKLESVALELIKVEDENGKLINVTSTVEGTKLIVRPDTGEWEPNQSFILIIPQGAMRYVEGSEVGRFEYPFQTAEKYDYSETSIFVRNKKIAIGAFNSIRLYIRSDRPYQYSYENTGSTKVTNTTTGEEMVSWDYLGSVHNVWDTPGIYEVQYIVKDNGYTHEFTETFEVVDIDITQTKISSDREGFVTAIDYTSFEDEYDTKVTLRNGDMPLGYRVIQLRLIGKKSGKEYYTARGNTNDYGTAGFHIPLDGLPVGIFQVVLTCEENNKSYRYELQTKRVSGKANVNLLLYDNKTKKLIRSEETVAVSIDGGSPVKATRLNNYTYQIEGVRPGKHSIKLYDVPYYCDKTFSVNWRSGSNKEPAYLTPYVPSSKIYMNSIESDYGKGYGKDLVFIDGVDANITFEANASWNGHQPGKIIYEFYLGDKIKKYTTTNGKITLNMGDLWGKGTRGRVYAVSPDGTISDKRDMQIEVADKPLYCYTSYSEKKNQYFLNYNFSLETMGSATVPENWPLIGGDSLEINVGKFNVGGVMDPYGKIDFAVGLSKLDFENAKVKSNYKDLVEDFQAGNFGGPDSELSFSFDTNQSWRYDTVKNAWKYVHGDYILYLEGEVSYTQYFMVFVVPTYLKGSFGVDANAKLNVDMVVENPQKSNERLKYSGELNVSPSLEIAAGAGVSGLSVEGFFNGTIDMSMTIPDCDVSATGTITGGIRATALLWDWEKKGIEYTWVIAEKDHALYAYPILAYNGDLGLLALEDGVENAEETDFGMIARDKGDTAVWMGNTQVPEQSTANERVFDSILMDKVPNYTQTAVTAFGKHLFLVWPEDNPSRTSANRTELKYAIYDGLQWTEGEFFGQDATADYEPVVETTGETITIAWQDQSRVMSEQEKMEDYLAATEITVAEYVYDENTIGNIVTLTDDAYYDCKPVMAYSQGKTHLAWVKNTSNQVLSPTAGAFQIMYSERSGENWSTPIVLETGLNQVTDLDITADGSKVMVIYGQDTDGNIFTASDVELYGKQYADDDWLSSIRLTNDKIQDANARIIMDKGEAIILWLKDGVLTEMHFESQTASAVNEISAQAFEIIHTENEMNGLVYITPIQDGLQETAIVFYDSSMKQWSESVVISQNECVNSRIQASITTDNHLDVIYKAGEKISEEIDGSTYENIGDTHIQMHEMFLVKDLKVVEGTIGFDTTFIPEEDNVLQAMVENCGEFTVDHFQVAFYDGLMNEIGVGAINTPLLPGEQTEVSIIWSATENLSNGNITVVVDPEDVISDNDRANNVLTEEAITVDVGIEEVEVYPIDGDNYLLKLNLGNHTAINAENVQIDFYHNELLINTDAGILIEGGLQEEVLMELDTGSLFGESEIIDGRVEVKVSGALSDKNTDNNAVDLTFEKIGAQIVSSNITDGETDIPTNAELELDFSSNINDADGFDEITVTDFAGNEILIQKEITQSRLKITPVQELKTGNYYCLTIPPNAVSSVNGQTLESDYILTFTTGTSHLSVTGTYPLDGWTSVDRGEDILLRFNTDISEDVDFENIRMLKNDTSAIPTGVTIDGNMLVINPSGSLLDHTVYTVRIPAWAVADEKGNTLENEYVFSFTTEGENPGDPEKNDENDGTNQGNMIPATEMPKEDGRYQEYEHEFIVDLLKDTSIFIITDELAEEIRSTNKPLRIVRDDIILTLDPEQITNGMDVGIEKRLVNGDKTHLNDRALSDRYILSIKKEGVVDDTDKCKVTIRVDGSAIKEPEKCGIFYLDEAGQWQPAGGRMNADLGIIQAALYPGRPFIVVERDIAFDDIIARWSQHAIEVMAAKGIVNGKGENRFDPLADISRAEFTALVVRSLFDGTSGYRNEFSDFQADAWYANAVQKAVEMKLVNGVGKGKFAPHESITREDIMVILFRLFQQGMMDETTEESLLVEQMQSMFSDFDLSAEYAQEAISKMVSMGIVRGNGGKIMPKAHATREEAVTMLYRLLELQ